MDDNYEKILWEGYGLHFLGGNRIRTGYLCKTEQGIFEVRKSIAPLKQILFEHDIREHLAQQGFYVSQFLCTQQKLPYYSWEGNHYTVENAIEAEPLDEEEKQTFIIGAKLLAKLHKALNGFYSSFGYFSGKNRLEIYEKRRIELLKIKKRIEKQSSYTPLDLLVKQQFPYYMEKIEQAKQLFLEINYQKAIYHTEKQRTICHNVFKGENIRQNAQGILLTGLSKCTYDHNMVDFVMYFRRFLKNRIVILQQQKKCFLLMNQKILCLCLIKKCFLLCLSILKNFFLFAMNIIIKDMFLLPCLKKCSVVSLPLKKMKSWKNG